MVEAFRQYDGQLSPPSGALQETVERTISIMASSGGAVLAWEDALPIGSARYYYKEDYMYIGRVAVHPDHRGKGIGKRLMAFLEEHARKNGRFQTRLEVRLSLPDNIQFYKRLGYQVVEQIYYPDRTDSWYVMNKRLTE
jgi:ribosomal protein S18 acetylase RimI-like enzyme